MQQLSLFDDPGAELVMLVPRMKTAMHAAAVRSGLSRDEIVDQMNAIASQSGVRLTRGNAKGVKVATLEKWLNPSSTDHQPTWVALNVFCRVVKDVTPLGVMLGLHGCGVMTLEDKKLRDYADAILAERKARKKKKQLEMEL